MGSLERRLGRLEASAATGPVVDEEALQNVEDWLDELAIHRGEMFEEDVPNLEESRRRANEAAASLVGEWRRLEGRRWGA